MSVCSERRLPGLKNRFFRCSLELRRAPQLRACCSTGGDALTSARICGSGTTRSLKRPAHISSLFGPCSNRDAGHHHCPQPRTGRCGNRRRCCACGRVIVLPNVTIGRGAIVTAEVSSQNPFFLNHGGNPAQAIATVEIPFGRGVSLKQFTKGLRPIR